MPKPMLKLVRKEEEEDRGVEAPVLPGPRTGLLLLLRRLGSKSRGYALAGAGVVAGAVVVVSLLSWLAPDSDRPIASPLEAVGRVAGGVLEQVDEQVEALLGTDKGTVLRSVREGLAAAGSATPWPSGKSSEVAVGPSSSSGSSSSSSTASPDSSTASPDSSTASPDSASPSRDVASAPTRGESPSTASETPSQPALAPSPASTGETPPPTTDAPSPTTGEPTLPPATPEQPPAVEEPSPPPTEEPPATEEPPPPTTEEPPPPVTEEPPPVVTDPAPVKGPPETIADE